MISSFIICTNKQISANSPVADKYGIVQLHTIRMDFAGKLTKLNNCNNSVFNQIYDIVNGNKHG